MDTDIDMCIYIYLARTLKGDLSFGNASLSFEGPLRFNFQVFESTTSEKHKKTEKPHHERT